jgi:hypothetical protein
MSRSFYHIALLISVALAWPSRAATTLAALSPGGKSTLLIDGQACDRVLSWEGGDLRGTLLSQPSTTGGLATKTIGGATLAPLTLQIPLPLSPQLAALVSDLGSGRFIRHKLLLVDYNSTGVATGAFELSNAMLSGVTFPAFDASTAALDPVKLVFEAEQSSAVAVPGDTTLSLVSRGVSTFRLSIGGVDASRVVRIEPIAINVSTSEDTIGQTRSYTKTPGTVEFSTIKTTIGITSAASWEAWWMDFVVKGNATESDEKNAVLELMDSSGAPLSLALNFTHVGILRLSRPSATAGAATKLDAEMYFEGLSLGKPVPTSSTSSTNTAADTTASPSSTDAAASNPTPVSSSSADTASADSPATAVTSAPTTASSPSIVSRTPVPTDVPLVSSTSTLSTAQQSLLNPADVGTRDPAQFPRVDGLTRTYYSGTFQPVYTSEQADYSSSDAIGTVVARVDAAAKAAGWTMTTVTETAPNGGKNVAESWTKGSANASVNYAQPINATGTQLNLQVYVRLSD